MDCRQLWKPVLTGTRQIWVQRCGFPGPLRKGRGEGVSKALVGFRQGKWETEPGRLAGEGKEI